LKTNNALAQKNLGAEEGREVPENKQEQGVEGKVSK